MDYPVILIFDKLGYFVYMYMHIIYSMTHIHYAYSLLFMYILYLCTVYVHVYVYYTEGLTLHVFQVLSYILSETKVIMYGMDAVGFPISADKF